MIYFDDSVRALVEAVIKVLGVTALEEGVILRDATGYLTFVSAREADSAAKRTEVERALREALQAYARDDRTVLFKDDPGAERLLTDPGKLYVQIGEHFCQLIDRRIVGSGWLNAPSGIAAGPPRIVFASLKGGVGRTTALAVAACDQAERGRNVLIIDLDLEAPGLGDAMLERDRTPPLGVVDYLVENGIRSVSISELDSFVGVSQLTGGGGGRIDVVPALGSRSAESPQNILPKLARAMIESVTKDGTPRSVGDQISSMISQLTVRSAYDVVLIDSRAGMAELAAPALLGLGAVVLLFGTAQRQTFAGYRALLAALKLLAMREREQGEAADWRLRFKPVYAKATLDKETGDLFAAEMYELFADNLYDTEGSSGSSDLEINFSADDPDAPHAPLVIPFNPSFVEFDPSRTKSHLSRPFYEQTFRQFLNGLDELMKKFYVVDGPADNNASSN